ncbi:YqgE/AlgH family protein [Novosphingobium sp.]|uniref:YqgE/AlgH family protein n=1 Tax=Novosphingobium sp. TaxID=1874826 RepID=UPI00286E2583|nr:YqgE/AlgH family protein [Novosphingobium sp.]
MTESQFLAGRLLLAMPGMGDPRFDHSVIAMITHDESGAFGLGLGHLREGVGLHEILEELDIDPGKAPDAPVHDGGPVEPTRGFILHSRDWQDEESLDAGPLGMVSASLDLLRAIAEGRGPERWLMTLGFAGWGPGQLDNEMRHHGWYAADGHPEVIWETRAAGRWQAAWRAEGIDPSLLASETGTA